MATPEELIAAAAVEEIPERGSVLLEAGPAERLARSMPRRRDLTVITNSMAAALALAAREDVTVLLIGGRIQAGVGATMGGSGATGLEGLHADVAFMAADGVSAQRGLTTRAPAECAPKRMMLRAADRTVLLAPGGHIGHVALARFGSLNEVDCLITDSPCDTPDGRRVAVAGPRMVRV
ncbi:DeoR/GlpR family DNA-binding transcription regulator [Streptomonospora sediminis]